jgi:hypothetical protein
MAKNAVTKAATMDVAVAAASFEDMAGAGLENVTANDLLIPRLVILQSNSPQVLKTKAEYIKGAVVGQICDVGMGELFEGAVPFIPVYFVKQWLEWYPRNTQKGLAEIHDTDAILAKTSPNEKKKPVLPNGNLIAETHQFYGINLASGSPRKSFIPFASTQIKKAKHWNTLSEVERWKKATGEEYMPARFSRVYFLTTAAESNAEGDWIGWKIERGPALALLDDRNMVTGLNPEIETLFGTSASNLFAMAKSFYESIQRGEAKADLASMADEATGSGAQAPSDEAGAM